ncbi:MAG TPA: type II toxin-antitoxin system RelE/ParE family toxin [Candidatus Kapabacteria bacterium]|nr:type II toxin-antitoxin system RelE/ParE family toxin [Candidatus Kapabacteria bacterium]
MKFEVRITPKAEKDYRSLSANIRTNIYRKMIALEDDLHGDVKKLTNFEPPYRLRVGDYRVLFDVEGTEIVIYRILHRRESYR